MLQDQHTLVKRLDGLLQDEGLVACLCALAQAIRSANDQGPMPPRLATDRQLGYVREYVANQVMGLAAFWRVQQPESVRR